MEFWGLRRLAGFQGSEALMHSEIWVCVCIRVKVLFGMHFLHFAKSQWM